MVLLVFFPPLVLHFLLSLPVELSLDLQNSGPASLLPTTTCAALQYFCHLHIQRQEWHQQVHFFHSKSWTHPTKGKSCLHQSITFLWSPDISLISHFRRCSYLRLLGFELKLSLQQNQITILWTVHANTATKLVNRLLPSRLRIFNSCLRACNCWGSCIGQLTLTLFTK